MDAGDRYRYAWGQLLFLGADRLRADSLSAWQPSEADRLAIANPAHAPYGMAARQALESLDRWEQRQDRIVIAESVQHAFELVRRGDAEYGLTALALVQDVPADRWARVDQNLHQPINQEVGIPTMASNPAAAREFVQFLLNSRGRAILSKYGFSFPDGE